MVNRDTVGINTTCEKCSPGFYNDIPGNETCKNCPIGHYQNEEGIPYCIGCIPGKYQSKKGKEESLVQKLPLGRKIRQAEIIEKQKAALKAAKEAGR